LPKPQPFFSKKAGYTLKGHPLRVKMNPTFPQANQVLQKSRLCVKKLPKKNGDSLTYKDGNSRSQNLELSFLRPGKSNKKGSYQKDFFTRELMVFKPPPKEILGNFKIPS